MLVILGPQKEKLPFKKINFSIYFSHKAYRAFSLARPAPLQIYWNKRNFKVENTIMINVTPSENALLGVKGAEGLFTGFLA